MLALPIMNIFLFNFLRSEKFPIVYKNLSLLGLIRFCTIICIFSDYVPACRASRFSLYIGTGAGAVYVPILSLFCSFSEI